MAFRTLDQANVAGKRVLVRVDFNVPMHKGVISDDMRLRAALPTINDLRTRGAKVVLLSHFDRPKGRRLPAMSLRPVVEPLAALLGVPVDFVDECVGPTVASAINALPGGGVILLENVRFHPGEGANDPAFSRALAALADVYVDDSFSTAHRAHASTEGVARLLPAFAGRSMQQELEALERALGSPARPVMGVVGGSKISTKLDLLKNLVTKLDRLAIGGGMANTFLAAQGYDVAASMCEPDLGDTAREIIDLAKASGCELLLPTDVVVSDRVEAGAPAEVRTLGDLRPTDRILDAGPTSVARIMRAMDQSRTLIWNGPLGVFEVPPFDRGTVAAAQHVAPLVKSGKLVAVAGGGDTVSALKLAGVAQDFTYVSTAGGAFLEWMEGKTLPGVAVLEAETVA